VSGHAQDSACPVLINGAEGSRQRQLARRIDPELAAGHIKTTRPAHDAGRAVCDQVTGRLEHQVPGVADWQQCELGSAGEVPQHSAVIGAHGQDPAIATDRGAIVIHRPHGSVGKRPILQRRIDDRRRELVFDAKDDPSVRPER
jgi:hypothetical protein